MARKHKIQKALTHLVQAIIRFAQKLTSRNTYRFLRTAFVTSRRRLQAGFVLPTTTLLIIVMMLVVSTLMFRSYQRSTEVIGDYQKQELLNAATPSIERARAKLEQMFDPRYLAPGVPTETVLENSLLENNPDSTLSYTFPGETAVSLSTNDGENVPAWLFRTDANNNGKTDDPDDLVTVYTILSRTDRGGKTMNPNTGGNQLLKSDQEKADAMLVRSGPILTTNATNDPTCRVIDEAGEEIRQGWFPLSSSILKKNFQVYALTLPNRMIGNNSASNPMLSTIEYQQDRYYEQGNKWGAWFRSDMEVYPGPEFKWNGAMHTEGSMFMKALHANGFHSFLISSQGSCFYEPDLNSELSAKNQIVFAVPAAPDLDSAFKGPVYIDVHEQGDPTSPVAPQGDSSTGWPQLNAGNDSVDLTGGATAAINIAIDPKQILLNPNASEPRSTAGWKPINTWSADNPMLSSRIALDPENQTCPPTLDDVYRADDRFGPKTIYSRAARDDDGNCTIDTTESVEQYFDYGEYIAELTPEPDKSLLLRNDPPSADQPDEYGLDGYWERRARDQGTRIIVGQRLELGNAFGWVRDFNRDGDVIDLGDKNYGTDPLNPFNLTTAYAPMNGRQNELRQRKTLYDNLAAVQATAVYTHGDGSEGFYPSGYVATTVHPGTPTTLRDSATFNEITFKDGDNQSVTRLNVDFFSGKGTNGWEFAPLFEDESDFAAQINGATPLRRALQNLANFAGDPNGAFPAAPPPSATADVPRYPSPQLTMFGDYSKLRQIMADLNANQRMYPRGVSPGVSSPDLSIADQSTLHTASATLGMLAYNIQNLEDYDYGNPQNKSTGLNGGNQKGLDALATKLWDIINLAPTNVDKPPEFYIKELEKDPANAELLTLAHLIMRKEQVNRDRTYGFKLNARSFQLVYQAPGNPPPSPQSINISCDVTNATGNGYFGITVQDPTGGGSLLSVPVIADQQHLIGLSRLCSNEPKFPALYYLFPKFNHDYNGDNETGSGGVDHTQPAAEPYISSAYITASNAAAQYQVLDSANPDDLSSIALQPRKTDFSDWVLPNKNGPAGTNPNSSSQELILVGNQLRQVPIKDSALYDGRENMTVRVLNLDMNMFRQSKVNGDFLIPEENGGIVYAFREDAVREDAISRPANIDEYVDIPGDREGQINLKSVDYYADPDRRPYGFRFKNGTTLRREGSNLSRGMTFVTDNPVYTQGQFNLHSNSATGTANTIQEFTQTLTSTFSAPQFYGRSANNRNVNFADPSQDWWRNVEIIADSITILSNNFCDGSIEDGIIFAGIANPATTAPTGYNSNRRLDAANRQRLYGCNQGSTNTSFINQNRPNTTLLANTYWARENPWEIPRPTATPDYQPTSPIAIDKNGIPQTITYPAANQYNATVDFATLARYPGNYNTFGQDRQLITAADTTTNMVLISGMIPSRTQQINGGFHNFPRVLENWKNIPLTIQGSLIQLYFSNYATAPFDQDAWEYPVVPAGGAAPQTPKPGAPVYKYYVEPQRNWGYDVALQKAPAGPAARRMSQVSSKRDEFYREPSADNAYICKLRALPEINYPCP
ncbi:hormogonium polysaccharide biosynthesis protein HpsA [Laspinema sp. A4]|uniref:hormogonium polysaccharide biosynthesis protein HpsA n=1 Tax=Laspinema sp. D2d TaxID=2953686 RepID=UPI0021BB42F9|nr:hormogonium polysaccharide biosynthesis protein HpsA [Laspinema sp. D2d]MCT7982828.1 hormogonium polysaccharide biosynthesis protein HpsA [Laspinema sp. D2d]